VNLSEASFKHVNISQRLFYKFQYASVYHVLDVII